MIKNGNVPSSAACNGREFSCFNSPRRVGGGSIMDKSLFAPAPATTADIFRESEIRACSCGGSVGRNANWPAPRRANASEDSKCWVWSGKSIPTISPGATPADLNADTVQCNARSNSRKERLPVSVMIAGASGVSFASEVKWLVIFIILRTKINRWIKASNRIDTNHMMKHWSVTLELVSY